MLKFRENSKCENFAKMRKFAKKYMRKFKKKPRFLLLQQKIAQ